MPRLGLGSIDISSAGGAGQDVVTTIDDFFFESNASGEVNPILTTSRTNLVTYSEDFSNGFINTGTTDTLSTTESSPTGVGFSTLLVGDSSGSSTKRIRSQVTLTASKAHTFSVFVKSNSRTNIQIINSGDAEAFANFDIVSGTVGTKGSKTTSSITSEGNGWFRCVVTTDTSTTNGAFMIYLADSNSGGFGAPASGTSGVFIWGAQIEQDGFVSDYIPTSGAAVTVSTTLNDTSEVWDFDSTDLMLEADPEDEGFWEEGSNLVLNHDYEDLGSELLSQPVDLQTDFTAVNGASFTDANTLVTTGGSIEGFTKSSFLTVGKTYKLIIAGTTTSSGFTLGNTTASGNEYGSGFGTHYFTASGNTAFWLRQGSAGTTNITSFSIKQVDPNDRWSLTGGTSISDGKMTVTGASGTSLGFQSMLVQGTAYELTYTISNFSLSSGTTSVINNDGATIQSISGNGTFTVIFTHSIADGNLIFRATGGTNSYQVDNVTVREYAIQPQDV